MSCLNQLISCLNQLLSCLNQLMSCLNQLMSCLNQLMSCLNQLIASCEKFHFRFGPGGMGPRFLSHLKQSSKLKNYRKFFAKSHELFWSMQRINLLSLLFLKTDDFVSKNSEQLCIKCWIFVIIITN
jgi:hypothetical protein